MRLLEYLVPSRARRALLHVLSGSRGGFTVRELSRQARVTYAATHREVGLLEEVGLLRKERAGGALLCFWNGGNPAARALRSFLGTGAAAHDEAVLRNLKAWGAPLVGARAAGRSLSLEETLGYALALARRRPDVAKVWPVAFCRNRPTVDLDRLEFLAKRLGQRRALGFFLAVSRTLLKDRTLARSEARLRDRRVRKFEHFFLLPWGHRARELEKRRTPRLAREWSFWMNASMESFESCFRKFVRFDASVR